MIVNLSSYLKKDSFSQRYRQSHVEAGMQMADSSNSWKASSGLWVIDDLHWALLFEPHGWVPALAPVHVLCGFQSKAPEGQRCQAVVSLPVCLNHGTRGGHCNYFSKMCKYNAYPSPLPHFIIPTRVSRHAFLSPCFKMKFDVQRDRKTDFSQI